MLKSILTLAAVSSLALTMNVASASARSVHQVQKHHHHQVQNHRHHRVGVSLRQVRKQLRRRGYQRIRLTDRRLPVYRAKACKHGKRFNVRINRFGGIISRNRIGRCRF